MFLMLGVFVSVSTLYLGAGLGPTRAVGLTKVARESASNRGYDLAHASTTASVSIAFASAGAAGSSTALAVVVGVHRTRLLAAEDGGGALLRHYTTDEGAAGITHDGVIRALVTVSWVQ